MHRTNPDDPKYQALLAKARNEAPKLLSAGRILARQHARYFRPIIVKLRPKEVLGLGTVAVTPGGQFLYDPVFVARQTPKKVGGLIVHEACHLWNKHSKRRGTREPGKWNRNADRAINPPIIAMGLELPDASTGDEGCFPKDLGMPDGLSADEYYLADKDDPQGGGQGGDDDNEGDAQDGSGGGGGKGQQAGQQPQSGGPGKGKGQQSGSACHGACGGCAGNAVDGEAEAADAEEERSDAEMERVARSVSEAMRDMAAEGRGNVPAGWLRDALADLEPAKLPWGTLLAQALRTACAYRPGALQHRYDGPSRRQAAIGYGTGLPIMARMRLPVPEVTVMVDTSGSMGADALEDAAAETQGILKSIGAKIGLITCDAAVHGQGRISTIDEFKKLLQGGGGTDFRPAFKALEKQTPRPEVCVFISDCDGPWPSAPPAGIKVIVVRVGRYKGKPPEWCEVIEYEEVTNAA